jgi:large subunit ribosomal protein L11
MAQFCKDFNEKTEHIREDTPLRIILTAYKDKTYKFDIRSPPTAWMVKKACGIAKGSGTAGREKVGLISAKAIYEIAKIKKDMDPNI